MYYSRLFDLQKTCIVVPVQECVYIKWVKVNSGNAAIVFDWFHIVRQVVVIASWRTDYGK
jgi:hypothetical protein